MSFLQNCLLILLMLLLFGKESFSSDCYFMCSNKAQYNLCFRKCQEYFSNCHNCTCEDFCIFSDTQIDCKDKCARIKLDQRWFRFNSYSVTFYSEYYWGKHLSNSVFYFFRCENDNTCFCPEYCHYHKHSQCCYDYCRVFEIYYDTVNDFSEFYDTCEAEPNKPNNPFNCLDSGECDCLSACDYFYLGPCCYAYCKMNEHVTVSAKSMLDYVFTECNPWENDGEQCYKDGKCTCERTCELEFQWNYGCCRDYCKHIIQSNNNYDAMYAYVAQCNTESTVYPEMCFGIDRDYNNKRCSCKDVCRSLDLGNCCFKYCIEFRGKYSLDILKTFSKNCNATYFDEYTLSCMEPYICNCEESCAFFQLDHTNCCSEYCKTVGDANMYDLFDYYFVCVGDYPEISTENEPTNDNSFNEIETISEDNLEENSTEEDIVSNNDGEFEELNIHLGDNITSTNVTNAEIHLELDNSTSTNVTNEETHVDLGDATTTNKTNEEIHLELDNTTSTNVTSDETHVDLGDATTTNKTNEELNLDIEGNITSTNLTNEEMHLELGNSTSTINVTAEEMHLELDNSTSTNLTAEVNNEEKDGSAASYSKLSSLVTIFTASMITLRYNI